MRDRARGDSAWSDHKPAVIASGLPDSVPAWYTRPGRRHEIHDVGAAAVGADRQAAADDLSEAGEIRPNACHLLRAARRGAESRNHFVEDQKRALAIAERAQALEESGARRHDAHVAGNRLDERPPAICLRFCANSASTDARSL